MMSAMGHKPLKLNSIEERERRKKMSELEDKLNEAERQSKLRYAERLSRADEIIYLDDSKCPACERDEFRIDKPLILLLLGALALFGVVLLGLWKLTELVYPVLRGL